MRERLPWIPPEETGPCPHGDAGRAACWSLSFHLLSGRLKFPLSLQQHLHLSLQQAELLVLMEEELIGVR